MSELERSFYELSKGLTVDPLVEYMREQQQILIRLSGLDLVQKFLSPSVDDLYKTMFPLHQVIQPSTRPIQRPRRPAPQPSQAPQDYDHMLSVALAQIDKLPPGLKRKAQQYLEKTLQETVKPGPKELTPEEKIERVHHFHEKGLTQQIYCQTYQVSRYELQTCLRWYRANFKS